MKNKFFNKIAALFLAGLLMLFGCACNDDRGISPEEFAKEYILANNKPDAQAVDNCTLAGGEKSYQFEAKAANMSEKDYYMSISDNKASDYASFINYQNDYILNYRKNYYGSTDMKTEFGEVTAKKLDSGKLEKVKEYFKAFNYIDTGKILEAYKVRAEYKTTIADETKDNELFLLILNYDGEAKYFVSNESEEEFDNGFK